MKAFLSNICLRQSCYDCFFKSIKRQADITLADFWGIQNVIPQMDDDKGTSIVLIHSLKGHRLMYDISGRIRQKEVEIEVVERYNPSVIRSSVQNNKRSSFFKEIQVSDFERIVNKYSKQNTYRRMRHLAGIIKRRMFR